MINHILKYEATIFWTYYLERHNNFKIEGIHEESRHLDVVSSLSSIREIKKSRTN